jgi:scyllo-inosamine 4-kinase
MKQAAASARQARLTRVLGIARVPAQTPVPIASDSNDVWRIGAVVLRICWRGDRDRFAREAAVTAALPPEIPYPEIVDAGCDDELAWQVTRAVDGVPLAAAWPGMPAAHRRGAIHQIGQALAVLHAHPFPAEVTAVLAVSRPAGDTSAEALIGADLNPLPVQRALLLAQWVRAVPGVDPALIDDAEARLRGMADLDPLGAPVPAGKSAVASGAGIGCVHGDAHPANVLWRDGRVVALLDFEWVRLGPADLELVPYLADHPGAGRQAEARARSILGWLAESHPAAFAPPCLLTRLWLYQIAYSLRQVLIHCPGRPAGELAADQFVRRLRRVVASPGHLQRLLPAAAEREAFS